MILLERLWAVGKKATTILRGAIFGLIKENKMKRKWIALIIMVASLCFACACGENKDNSSNNSGSQDVSSESIIDNESDSTSSTEEESASDENSSSNKNESGINGGSMEGDNDLDWNNPQN